MNEYKAYMEAEYSSEMMENYDSYLKILFFGMLSFNGTILGKAVNKIAGLNIVDTNIINSLYDFVVVYNWYMYEINQDDTKERLFNVFDSVYLNIIIRLRLNVTLRARPQLQQQCIF